MTQASTAIAIGKSTAYAASQSSATTTEAIATGTGGLITFTGTDIYITDIAEDTVLDTAQANSLANSTIELNVAAPTFNGVVGTP